MRTARIVAPDSSSITSAVAPQTRPPAAASTSPCTTATREHARTGHHRQQPARSLIYESRSLDARTQYSIRRALAMVHGTTEHDLSSSTAVTAAFLAGALDDAIVISPQNPSAAGSCSAGAGQNQLGYRRAAGARATAPASDPALTSFDFVDQILKKLAARSAFRICARSASSRSLGGRPVRRALDGEPRSTKHSACGHLRRRQPVEFAGGQAATSRSVDDATVESAKGAWESGEGPREVFVRRVRRVRVSEL